jgi:predicted GIY-YIG superfamily endonuclease
VDVLRAAAKEAPAAPGVYFLLAGDGELVYIGKAIDLRRRLAQHARAAETGATPKDVRRGATVATVRWEVHASGDAAADREADLVVALGPGLNASMTAEGRWSTIVVDDSTAGIVVSVAREAPPAVRGRRVYGCFPHLGVGMSSPRGIACSEGYAALTRLLWSATVADASHRMPAPICGPSPAAVATVGPLGAFGKGLHRLLSGASSGVLPMLLAAATGARPPLEHPALRRDAEGAEAFFRHGPAALRDLRRRHAIRTRVVDRDRWRTALLDELRASIGDFVAPAVDDPTGGILGPRLAREYAVRRRR